MRRLKESLSYEVVDDIKARLKRAKSKRFSELTQEDLEIAIELLGEASYEAAAADHRVAPHYVQLKSVDLMNIIYVEDSYEDLLEWMRDYPDAAGEYFATHKSRDNPMDILDEVKEWVILETMKDLINNDLEPMVELD